MVDNKIFIGKRFGRITVLGVDTERTEKEKRCYWKVKCDCGVEKSMRSDYIKKKGSVSCGCLNKEILDSSRVKHGLSHHPLFKEWTSIKDRCYNRNCKSFHNYGGRGITMCNEWLHNAESFINWCLTNGYKEGLTLDRIDNDKGYSPDNCRWTTRKIQQNNMRRNHRITYNGETHTVAEWADIMNIDYGILIHRINRGVEIEKALTTPVTHVNQHVYSITYNNETHNLKEWSKLLDISYKALVTRLQSGWSIEKAFTTPVDAEKFKSITFNGETHLIYEWCKIKGWERHTISRRLKKGWSIEDALTIPPNSYQPLDKKKNKEA